MTQEAHTQGPWRFVPWHIEEGSSAVRAPDGHLICSTASDANARRIVACVNALAGIPIEAIESGVVAELVEAARGMLPNNLNMACNMSDEAIIPLDVTFGELRALFDALAKLEASK